MGPSGPSLFEDGVNMKKFSELIIAAANLADEEVDNAQWAIWFNDGLDDLAEVLFIPTKMTITPSVSGGFALPENLKTVLRVDGITTNLAVLKYGDDVSLGYKIFDNELFIQGEIPTEIILQYDRYPAHVSASATSANVDISDHYTEALVLFACAKTMAREDETERYNIFMQEYMAAKVKISKLVSRAKPGKSGIIEVFR